MTKYERAALAVVNRIRRAQGRKALKRLPKGIPHHLTQCPIARALDHGRVCVDDRFEVPDTMCASFKKAGLRSFGDPMLGQFKCPRAITRFVRWFDYQAEPGSRALAVGRGAEYE